MRNLGVGVLLIPLVLSLTASEAAQEPAGPELALVDSEATYLGPVLSDAAIEQRVAERRSTGAGLLNSYNVWTSFQNVKTKANGTITGHAYQICQNQRLIFGNMLFVGALLGPVDIRVQVNLNKGGGTLTCDFRDVTLGFWQLSCEADPRTIPPNYYKATARYTIIAGGSGSGRETAWFDLFEPC